MTDHSNEQIVDVAAMAIERYVEEFGKSKYEFLVLNFPRSDVLPLIKYILYGSPPGVVWRPILENNFVACMAKTSDDQPVIAWRKMKRWHELLTAILPHKCWGSEMNVLYWTGRLGYKKYDPANE